MIVLDKITIRFGGLVALDAVSAEFTAAVSGIIGPNGAGKTTTMNLISGFITPTSGKVLVDGDDILRMPPHQRTRWGLRRSFQREQIADDLSVWENVLAITDNLPGSRSDRRTEAEQAIDFAGVGKLRHRLGASLNTYERRLTDLARCFAGRPRLIMLDEPAGGLSPEETDHLGALVVRMARLSDAKVLVIDHDVDLIQRICSETLVLDFGRRIAFGPTREVLNDPAVKAAYLGVEHA
ncbi:ABC transporter ATP-binding protein [Rhodobacter sp. SY28-1]|uniref:ABC transporter ATP-binding protein n=1 Tax=Rhodobacter sp. SY28-1 TaxID=2562317 RepID=UPI0010C0A46A|nr:ATP-binding cassette domain-containing protein [Rhodobacter sp. SY28-1]